MNARQMWALLKARWVIASSIFLLTLAVTLTVSLLMPAQYVATASILLDAKPDPIAGSYPGLMVNSIVTTQVDVLTSERVARRVVRNLKLLEDPTLREQWNEETEGRIGMEQWLTDSFIKRLDVRPARDSNVIQVSYKTYGARQAAAMANGFVQAYLDTALELRVDPAREFSSFFDQRAKEARESLAQAQTRLSELQKKQGLLASDERLDIENSRLSELSTQVVLAQAQATDAASRVAEARKRPAEELPEVQSNSLIAALRSDLARQQARIQEMDAKVGEAHPQRRELASGAKELQARIDAEVKRLVNGLEANDAINQARAASLQAALKAQRERVLAMKAARDEAAVLSKELESAQRAYDAVVGRLQLTSLESQTTQAQAHWLTRASPPAEPSSPKIILNMVLATFLGAVLSMLTVLWLQTVRR